MRFNIRSQLLLPLLALMLGVVAMSTWTAWASGQRARQQIEAQLDGIAATVDAVSFPRNTPTLHLMKGLSGAEFLLCNELQQPIVDDRDRPITTLVTVPSELPSVGPREGKFEQTVQSGETTYFGLGVPLRHAAPGTTLYIFYPESLWHDVIWQALRPALYLGLLGGLASVVLTVAVTQRLARRIQGFERRTRLIAGGDLSPMPLPSRNDELRDLTRSVNEMAQRLADYRDAVARTERLRLLGQVSGGLAHQLRNGVTGARLAVQLHARACRDGPEAEALTVALRQFVLVESHLKRFLDLGKALQLRREPCRLDALVQEAVTLVGPQCRHADIELKAEVDVDGQFPIVDGDPGQLGHLLLNILTNALEAAGPGGRVAVRLRCAGARALVEIVDSGPGPRPDIAVRLFEPFVTGKPEGVGLGLAVARQVAEAHGGTIAWQRVEEGTSFRIELPLSSVGARIG